jgi:hypothetical protein
VEEYSEALFGESTEASGHSPDAGKFFGRLEGTK